jgi:hypothetical protein
MRRVKLIAAACALAVTAVMGMNATAQDLNPLEKTFLTFSAPVELPGMTLPAGTYVFKLADTAGRNVVQVLSQDEREVHGQFLFMQHSRPEISSETVVTFRETREGATPAVQYWYYPNERIGKEFIYPKDQAMQIAARTGGSVLTEDGRVSASGQVVTDQAPAADASAAAQPSAAAGSLAGNRGVRESETEVSAEARASGTIQGAGLPAEEPPAAVGTSGRVEAQASAQREPEPQPESAIAQNELPRTASPLALTGLLGLLSLAGAAGIRFLRA